MARPPVLSLSDFETDDHAVIQQAKAPAPHTLIDFAKQYGYHITPNGGFTHGTGHSKGSMHYQGSAADPGAIDIDHRGVDYNKLLTAAKASGYNVLDEVRHPSAASTGPHYHISKQRNGQKQVSRAPGQKKELPAAAKPIKTSPVDLKMPLTTDAEGNLAYNQVTPSKVDIAKALKPVQKRQVADSVDLSEFELSPDELAEVKATADQYKPQPIPATTTATPKDPNFIEGVGNVLNAGVGMLKQIPGAFQKEYQSAQQNPLFNQQEMMGAAITGALSTPTDLINLVTQAPAAIGNAYAGRQVWKPSIPEVYGVRDIPGLKQLTERHPVADFAGGAVVPVEGALGALAKGKIGKTAKAASRELPIPEPQAKSFNTQAEIIQNLQNIENANKIRQIGQDAQAGIRPEPRPEQVNTRELTQAFRERGGEVPGAQPKGNLDAQILGSDGRPVVQQSNKLKTPYEIALERTRELPKTQEITPNIEVARGLPERQPVNPSSDINPVTGRPYDAAPGKSAEYSAEVLARGTDEQATARQIFDDAVKTYTDAETAIKQAAGVDDLAEAQRVIGNAVNNGADRTVLDNLFNARKELEAARSILDDVQQPTPRSVFKPPTEIKPQSSIEARPTPIRELPRAEDVNTPKPQRLPDNPTASLPNNVREIGSPQILDASGQPIKRPGVVRELEIPGRVKPADSPLELPRRYENNVRELPIGREASSSRSPNVTDTSPVAEGGNIYRAPDGGEVYTHGRDVADIQQQLERSKGQIANIADIERHLQTHKPEAISAIRNILDAGKNSEAVQFSYVAREAPGEAPRARANFVPTHFTYETIKPATQRTYLRRLHGSDEAVISHLKQEIVNRGGSIDASMLQNKSGGSIAPATQITKLINALDAQTGGAYLKSPRVHGINLGETTRSATGDRGIRLDTITESSLTGRKVTPDELGSHSYNNQIAPALKALSDLADTQGSPVFKRAVKQIQKGEINRKTMRELKTALADKKLAAEFCNVFGVKL